MSKLFAYAPGQLCDSKTKAAHGWKRPHSCRGRTDVQRWRPRFRLGQLIADVLKGNALGECASVNAAHTVRVDGLIRDGGLCRAGLAVTLVLADNGINFFFLGAGELFGLFGFAGYRFSGQWPLPPVPFGIAAQGRRKHCWSDRAFPWDG